MAVLTGKMDVLVQCGGNVDLDLRPILKQLGQRAGLGSRLEGRLPPDAGQIVIMNGKQLGTARKAVKVVRALSYFLFFLVIGLVAAAMWIAQGRRRRILLGAGVTVLVVGLIVLVVRRFAGEYLVNALTTNTDG